MYRTSSLLAPLTPPESLSKSRMTVNWNGMLDLNVVEICILNVYKCPQQTWLFHACTAAWMADAEMEMNSWILYTLYVCITEELCCNGQKYFRVYLHVNAMQWTIEHVLFWGSSVGSVNFCNFFFIISTATDGTTEVLTEEEWKGSTFPWDWSVHFFETGKVVEIK